MSSTEALLVASSVILVSLAALYVAGSLLFVWWHRR